MESRDKKAQAASKEIRKREREYTDHPPTREDAKKINAQRKEASAAKTEATKRTIERQHSSSNTKKQRVVSLQAKSKKATKKKKKRKKKGKKKRKKSSKKRNYRMYYMIATIVLLCIIITLATILILRSQISKSPSFIEDSFKSVTIEQGASASSIAALLEKEGIIDNERSFLSYIDRMGSSQNLLAGTYNFALSSDYGSVHQALSDVQLSQFVSFTIFDGSPIKEIDAKLTQRQLIAPGEFIEAVASEASRRNLSFEEGWLLGGTYTIERGPSVASQLAVSALDAMNRELKKYWEYLIESDFSLEEILIIASMVQRETQDPTQMPIIAQVIYNRLAQDEPLGIDATTRYALSKWNEPLEKGDFSQSKEYNTRTKRGLPPTGIGSVGKEALASVIFPSQHDYLFYLHDKEGALHLGRTYQEHIENIEKYL